MNQELHEIKQFQDSSFPIEMYYITRESITPNGRGFMDIHWHEELQLTLVTRGTLTIRVDHTSYVLNEGDAIFINRNLVHITTDMSEAGQYVSFNFPDKLLCFFPGSYMAREDVLPLTNHYQFCAKAMTKDTPWQREIIYKLWEMYDLFSSRPSLYQYKVSVLLVEIWLTFITNMQEAMETPSPSFIRNQNRIQSMLSYIHKHYADDIHPLDIAHHANISIGECNRCFRQMINLSPMQYVLDYRMEQATDLLLHTDLSVTEIALQCGFNTSSYFIQQFRKKLNMTPREYRETRTRNSL